MVILQAWARSIGEASPISTENRDRDFFFIPISILHRDRGAQTSSKSQDKSRDKSRPNLDSPRLFWQIFSKSRDKSRPNLDSPRLFGWKSGRVEAIPTLPDFWLKVGESRDWPRLSSNCLGNFESRGGLPDLDFLKSRGGLPDLDLDPTRFLSRYYPPRDISPMPDVQTLTDWKHLSGNFGTRS